MATLSRRANSLPARPVALVTGPVNDLCLGKPDVEAKVSTSPSLAESRSPSTVSTFSPLFDLELGGSCSSTPQHHSRHKATLGGPSSHGPHQRSAPVGDGHLRRPPAPPPAGAAAAAVAATPGTAALQKLPLTQLSAKAPAARASAGLDRSASDLQVFMLARRNGGCASLHSAELRTPAAERLEDLCRPSSEFELVLSKRLRAFRAARIAKQPLSGPGAATSNRASASALQVAVADLSHSTTIAAAAAPAPPTGPTPGEIEALASELHSDGFLVKILDGTGMSKDAKSCLRTLKHRFLVCRGWAPPQRRSLQGSERRLLGAAVDLAAGGRCTGSGGGACGSCEQQQQQPGAVAARLERLPEPLVVEVRFREQFLIANPTPAYELLLLALPVVFVGPLGRLDAVVELMAAEVAAVFRSAKRPLPPWRTKVAMLSKWAPGQLEELGRHMERQRQQHEQQEQAAAAAEQRQQEQVNCDRSRGSAVGLVEAPNLADAAAAAVSRDPRLEPLFRAPRASSSAWPWPPRTTADGFIRVPIATATGAGAADGLTDVVTVEEVVPRSNSAPPRTASGPRGVEAAAAEGAGGGGGSCAAQSEDVLRIVNLESLDHLIRDNLTSISQVETTGGTATATVVAELAPGEGKAGEIESGAMAGLPGGFKGAGRVRDGVELSFPLLPEVVTLAGPAGPVGLLALQQQQRDEQQQLQPQAVGAPVTASAVASAAARQVGGGEAPDAAAGAPPPEPSVAPTFRPMGGLSALSPFACISVPEQYESEYDDQDNSSPDGGRVSPWSAQLPTVGGGGASLEDVLYELTFKHTPLGAVDHGMDLELNLGERDAPAGGAARSPTLPLPTAPRPAILATTAAGVVAGEAVGEAPLPQPPSGVGLASSPAAAAAAAALMGLPPTHEPLGPGALGHFPDGRGNAATAAPAAAVSHLDGPSASQPAPRGSAYPFPYPKADTELLITRRSSSDLHRAAEKCKKATSLLATALRVAKGGGGSGGAAVAAMTVAASGLTNQQQQQQQQRDGQLGGRGTHVPMEGGAGAAAGTGGSGMAATARRPGGGGGGAQVALTGGVLIQPSGDEPIWARIRTVKWTQPAAAASAAAAAGAAPPGATRTAAGLPA